MTGNVTGIAIAASRFLRLAKPSEQAARSVSTASLLVLVIAFGAGCAAGAVAQAYAGLAAMTIVGAALVCTFMFGARAR